MPSIFDTDLPRTEANFAPLTPLAFIQRAAEVYPKNEGQKRAGEHRNGDFPRQRVGIGASFALCRHRVTVRSSPRSVLYSGGSTSMPGRTP